VSLTDPNGLDFYLQCADKDHNGCVQVQTDPNNSKSQAWVQADQNGTAQIAQPQKCNITFAKRPQN
jgi:hypothetical protein